MFSHINDKLSKNLPDNFTYEINLGKYINDRCFKVSLDKEVFYNIKNKFDKLDNEVSIRIEKHYVNFDTTLIINNSGERRIVRKKSLNKIDMKTSESSLYDMKVYCITYEDCDDKMFKADMSYHSVTKITTVTLHNDFYDVLFKISMDDNSKEKEIIYSIHFLCKNKIKISKKNPLKVLLADIESVINMKVIKLNDVTEVQTII